MHPGITTPHHTTPARVNFIDLLRGWAVVVMIETHVMNATLSQTVASGWLFPYITFVNGLVAPSFLFASGLAFAVTTRRKLADYLSPGPPLLRQFGRLSVILFIGYMLHVPVFSLGKILSGDIPEHWQSFFQVDILQCIAVTLLGLQTLLLLLRSERLLYGAALLLALAVVAFTPWAWSIDFNNILPLWLAAYMNGIHYSLFPLFPWAAFLLAGAVAGYAYLRTGDGMQSGREQESVQKFVRTLPWVGGSAILFSMIIAPFADVLFPPHNYWRSGPSFFFLRFGLVVLLCALLVYYDRIRTPSRFPVITMFGKESLLVYVLHLLIIYGNFGPFNLRRAIDHSFGYAAGLLTTFLLLLAMFAAAFFWNRTKRESPRLQRVLSIATLLLVILMFIFGEG
jgi:uncharacterized membrane protein